MQNMNANRWIGMLFSENNMVLMHLFLNQNPTKCSNYPTISVTGLNNLILNSFHNLLTTVIMHISVSLYYNIF